MKVSPVEKISTRGWQKIRFESTRTSTMDVFRKKCAEIFGHIKDCEPCMWTFELRFPPAIADDKTQRGVRAGKRKSAGRDPVKPAQRAISVEGTN